MTTIAPDTILALWAAASASPDLAGVTVVDGPKVADTSDLDRLFIGADLDPTAPSGEGSHSPETLPGVVDVETFSIACVAESRSGEVDVPTRRARAFQIREAVRPLLRPSPAGVVLNVPALQSAFMGTWQLQQVQTSRGMYVGISFRIECIAKPATS